MTTPVLADIHMNPHAESHVRVSDSCNCCVPFFSRKVVIMELPSDPIGRKNSHTVHTITQVTTETFRESQ